MLIKIAFICADISERDRNDTLPIEEDDDKKLFEELSNLIVQYVAYRARHKRH